VNYIGYESMWYPKSVGEFLY